MSLDCKITDRIREEFGALWTCSQIGDTLEIVTPYLMPDSRLFVLYFTERKDRFIACDGGRIWDLACEHSDRPKPEILSDLRALAKANGMKEGADNARPLFFKDCSEEKLIASISFDVANFATMAANVLVAVAEEEDEISEEREPHFQTEANNHLATILRPNQYILPTRELPSVPGVRFGAIVEQSSFLWVISYISGNSLFNFKKNIANTGYNFRDVWNSPEARSGRIKKTITVMNSKVPAYDRLKLQHRISMLKDDARGTEPISWEENYLWPGLLDAA